MREGTVTLPDGRSLGYAEYGVSDGIPILFFHGMPGGRFYILDADALERRGARLLTLERPAIGLSDPNPGRTLLDWPHDVAGFADALGIEQFAVLGMSMGGPSSVACAHALPDRVAVAGLACAVGPLFDQPQFDPLLPDEVQALLPIARTDQDASVDLVREFTRPTSDAYRADPVGFFDTWLEGWLPKDRLHFLEDRPRWERLLDATYAAGPDAFTEETVASVGPWGFDPAEVTIPVRAWHGDADEGMTPIDVIRWLVTQIPDASLVEYAGETHALDHRHHDDWLVTLTAWAR